MPQRSRTPCSCTGSVKHLPLADEEQIQADHRDDRGGDTTHPICHVGRYADRDQERTTIGIGMTPCRSSRLRQQRRKERHGSGKDEPPRFEPRRPHVGDVLAANGYPAPRPRSAGRPSASTNRQIRRSRSHVLGSIRACAQRLVSSNMVRVRPTVSRRSRAAPRADRHVPRAGMAYALYKWYGQLVFWASGTKRC